MIVCNTSLICSGLGVFSSIRTTMSDDGDHTCPLCAEEMDITDQQLKPCKCGYDVCISIISLSYQSVCTYLLSNASAAATTLSTTSSKKLPFTQLIVYVRNSADLRLVLAPHHRHGWKGGDRGLLPCMSHSLRQGQDCQDDCHLWEVHHKLSAIILSFTLLMPLFSASVCVLLRHSTTSGITLLSREPHKNQSFQLLVEFNWPDPLWMVYFIITSSNLCLFS